MIAKIFKNLFQLSPTVLFFLGLMGTLSFANQYLESNFYMGGEAFFKGSGHLLSEDFSKGLTFIIVLNFLTSTFLFALFFTAAVESEAKNLLFKFLNKVALVVFSLIAFYTVAKVTDIRGNQYYDQIPRVVEISLSWTLRISGIYSGYLLNKLALKLTNQETL
ncbi:MAG TPA: hypothetical protein VEC36_08220 [Patescibacteria group bacterium]|nr:hypothetical protein [Patescibacteria group bacterium]